MKKLLVFTFGIMATIWLPAQPVIRQLDQLIIARDPGWPFVQQMIDAATNSVEVLPADSAKARIALYQTQVTTRSPMGAVIFNTGGILVDKGWIRILGSGSKKISRSLPGWNQGKTFFVFGETPAYTLIADDVVGGFFAINGGGLGKDRGQTYYLSPDRLVWEPLNMSYTDFLRFCFSDSLDNFYARLRWKNWEQDLVKLKAGQSYRFSPFLWTAAGKDINQNKRKKTTPETQYRFNMEARKQLGLDKQVVEPAQ